jgi:DNA-binding beta-propeller fold protein YncE
MIKKMKCLAVLVSLAVVFAFQGSAFAQSSGGVLYSLLVDVSAWPYTHAIEAVDLSTGSHIKTINLGGGYGPSIAVSPDQTRLYVGRYVEADGSADLAWTFMMTPVF